MNHPTEICIGEIVRVIQFLQHSNYMLLQDWKMVDTKQKKLQEKCLK